LVGETIVGMLLSILNDAYRWSPPKRLSKAGKGNKPESFIYKLQEFIVFFPGQ